MNRRRFLVAAGAATATPAAASTDDRPVMDWEKVLQLTDYTAVCEQATDGTLPNIKLQVQLGQKDPESPWSTFIRVFKLTWNGQEIAIPQRFWNDLDHVRLEDYPKAEISKVPAEKREIFNEQLGQLQRPRLILSAESGTVLIEWRRGEECDSHSIIRWIVSKSGVVLRHRHEPFHLC